MSKQTIVDTKALANAYYSGGNKNNGHTTQQSKSTTNTNPYYGGGTPGQIVPNAFVGNTNEVLRALTNAGVGLKNGFTTGQPVTDGQRALAEQSAKPYNSTTKQSGYSGSYLSGIGAFAPSSAYTQAMEYTNQLLSQLSSGRTSYTDRVNEMMDKINSRESFSYDPDTDPLFQQYLQNSMESGRKAMNDTIGQASALTGGYGSSYATAAANGAYNNYVQDAYNNLDDYYRTALEAYEAEGQDLYNKLGMYQTADATEYDRLATAYSANLANADSMYNKEYSNYWDTANYNLSVAKHNADQDYKNYTSQQSKDYTSQQSKDSSGITYKEATTTQLKDALDAYNKGGWDAFDKVVDRYNSDVNVEQIVDYVNQYGQNYTYNGNGIMINPNGGSMKIGDAYSNLLKQGYSEKEAKELLMAWGYSGAVPSYN